METSLNLLTCAAISSLMFSFRRHLSAVLGGGAARRPAWANSVPGRIIAKISGNSRSPVFIAKILAAPEAFGRWMLKTHHGGTETRRKPDKSDTKSDTK